MSRRKHSRCTTRPSAISSANDTGTITSGDMPERGLRHPGQVGAEHQELAVRDVQDAHQPVLQVQPERDQRVDAAGDQAGGEQLEPAPSVSGHVHFQAASAAFSGAVAIVFGHTTSNSPFCHWLTVPGVPTFSLPANLMLPMMVLCSVPAT